MFIKSTYNYLYTIQILLKQLHINKQENNSVNVVKLFSYDTISAAKQH